MNKKIKKEKQIETLTVIISWLSSRDITDIGKKLALWLLEKSEKLTKPVCVTLFKDEFELTHEIRDGFNNVHTYMSAIFDLMGSEFNFRVKAGKFFGDSWMVDGYKYYTFWLSAETGKHGRQDAERLEMNINEIGSIELPQRQITKAPV